MKQKLQEGFTLIELLVVIAIIGLLASVVLVSLNSARAKARDARRKSDLRQLRTALEMYYQNNDQYPSCQGDWAGESVSYGCMITALKNAGLIDQDPKDPQYPAQRYRYDNFCGDNSSLLPSQFRMWTNAEVAQPPDYAAYWTDAGGQPKNWIIGESNCKIPF